MAKAQKAKTDRKKEKKKDKKAKESQANPSESNAKQHGKSKKDKNDNGGKKGKKEKRAKGSGKVAAVESPSANLSRRIRKGDKLASLKCVPCRGGVPPLGAKEIEALLPRVHGWKAVDGHHLEREFKFPDFAQALEFTLEIGEVAEVEQHHPDIYLAWGKVGVKIWTHKINGLTESDFVLAAKIDQLI